MQSKVSLVLTTINAPNAVMKALAAGTAEHDVNFYIIGDTKSPSNFELEGARYFDIPRQLESGFSYAVTCPTRHYARKNIGYLMAMRDGAEIIIETDDDNFPRTEFFSSRIRKPSAAVNSTTGWINVYRYFTESNIWPRGLPLQVIHRDVTPLEALPLGDPDCPIQQGLADENPDVDAIYRMTLSLPQSFSAAPRLALAKGVWCPFNSQNTTWWRDAFPLLYLPAHCSFRMTDIWRSFVAQRIAWENGWLIFFHGPTVWQERNEHDLLRDFADEVPGYLNNDKIAKRLSRLELLPGKLYLHENLRKSYRALVDMGLVGKEELALLDAWGDDLRSMGFDLD